MTIKKCFPLLLILSFLFVSSFAFDLDEEYEHLSNPQISPRREFEECQRKCEDQQFRGQERELCSQRCEQRFREREERERREHGRGHGGDDDVAAAEQNPRESARERLQQCRQGCERSSHESQQKQTCQRRCQEQYEEEARRERQEREHGGGGRRSGEGARERYEQCKERCERSQQQQVSCQRQCQQQFDEDVRREKQEREHGHGRRNPHGKDPEERFRECLSRCHETKQEQGQIRECEQECDRRYRRRGGDDLNESEEERWTENPYHFESRKMRSRFSSDEGHLKVLQKFSSSSKLLKGLQNYRVLVLEAAPNTFVVPHHCDADSLLVVTKGKGTITIVRQNNKESFNMETSDVVLARAGSTLYLVNQDNNQRLQITKLVSSINVPGQFEDYFPAGGDIQESYFKAFSTNILKQSLSATEEQIENLVGRQRQGQREGQGQRQRQGIVMRASQEQLKALTQHATSAKRKGGRESTGPISLRNMSPLYSNDFGKFFEAVPDQHKQLQDIDVSVAWTELKQGTIMVPHYNSKATVVVKVVEGTGRFEMACPHLERQQQQQQQRREEEEETTGRFQKVSSRLSPGDIFIIPAGHPVAVEASEGQTLTMVGFGVNARNNDRIFIAGKENMIKQLEREAKELAFNMAGTEVEEIFNQPKLSYFVPKESSREEGPRSHPLDSILNFAGFV